MKKFVNAAKGISQVFVAQFLAIFAGLAVGIAIVPDVYMGAPAVAGVLAICGLVLAILALIIELVGLHRAGEDNERFHHAFTFALATLFIELLVGILGAIWPEAIGGNEIVARVTNLVVAVLEIAGIYCVYSGIAEMAEAREEKDLAATARVLWNIIVVTLVGTLVLGLLLIVGLPLTIAAVMAWVLLALGLISDIAFLVLLGKAKNRMA